jgi:hypothetical protein
MPVVTSRVKKQARTQSVVSELEAGIGAEVEFDEESVGRSRWSEFIYTSSWVALILLAFALGLGSGYLAWGRDAGETSAGQANTAPPADTAQAASPAQQVSLPDSYTLPVSFGDLGPRLIEAGAIDYDRFVQNYEQAGQPLTEEQLALLTEGSDQPVTIDRHNAYFLLNFLWALGLTNQNPILTEGQMMEYGGIEKIGSFASTGGWTLGAKAPTELFASAALIPLTPEKQAHLEEVAEGVYRPCCNNHTAFADCNHGMAMLGLLALMASQDATTEEMFEAAKYINAFWFPQQTLEAAVVFKVTENQDFAQIDARKLVGPQFSSGSGSKQVHQWLADNGLLQQAPDSGGSCGA